MVYTNSVRRQLFILQLFITLLVAEGLTAIKRL